MMELIEWAETLPWWHRGYVLAAFCAQVWLVLESAAENRPPWLRAVWVTGATMHAVPAMIVGLGVLT